MSVGDRVWDALADVIKMNNRVTALADQSKQLAAKVEDLNGRVIRLETALEIAFSPRRSPTLTRLPRGKG